MVKDRLDKKYFIIVGGDLRGVRSKKKSTLQNPFIDVDFIRVNINLSLTSSLSSLEQLLQGKKITFFDIILVYF
jgi:hypothetical protein